MRAFPRALLSGPLCPDCPGSRSLCRQIVCLALLALLICASCSIPLRCRKFGFESLAALRRVALLISRCQQCRRHFAFGYTRQLSIERLPFLECTVHGAGRLFASRCPREGLGSPPRSYAVVLGLLNSRDQDRIQRWPCLYVSNALACIADESLCGSDARERVRD